MEKLGAGSKPLYRLLILVISLVAGAAAQTPRESLAPTPPMGWNSWNKFGCNVSEVELPWCGLRPEPPIFLGLYS